MFSIGSPPKWICKIIPADLGSIPPGMSGRVLGTFGGLSQRKVFIHFFSKAKTAPPTGVTIYTREVETYKTPAGIQSRSRGKRNVENFTGILWHCTPWARLKAFKHQPASESDSYKCESDARGDSLILSTSEGLIQTWKQIQNTPAWHMFVFFQ